MAGPISRRGKAIELSSTRLLYATNPPLRALEIRTPMRRYRYANSIVLFGFEISTRRNKWRSAKERDLVQWIEPLVFKVLRAVTFVRDGCCD